MSVSEERNEPQDPRVEWLKFYCSRHMDLLPVYEVTPNGCACGEAVCRPKNWGKHARINWGAGATSNFELVVHWHERWPTSNWAWALKDHFVIDIDPRNGGFNPEHIHEEWGNALGFELPETWMATTGGGGLHLVFRQPNGRDAIRNGRLILPSGQRLAGVDVKGQGGYVLVHPSNHRLGAYGWMEFKEPIEPPDELLELIDRKAFKPTAQRGSGLGDGTGHGDESGFDIGRWINEASEVPGGGQREWLLSGIGWMANRGRHEDEMRNLGWLVAQQFDCTDPDDPWRPGHVAEMVAYAKENWPATVPGNVVIPRGFNPNLVHPTVHPSMRNHPSNAANEALSGSVANGGLVRPPEGAPGGSEDGSGGGEVIPLDGDGGDDGYGRLTQVFMKDSFVEVFGKSLRWSDELGWVAWNGVNWYQTEHQAMKWYESHLVAMREAVVVANATDAKQAAEVNKQFDRWETTGHINSTVELARKDLLTEAIQFDAHHTLLNCPNGVVDLTTGALYQHQSSLLCRNVTMVPYQPGAQSWRLDEFHNTFLPDEAVRAWVYRVLGSCIVGGNPNRLMVFIVGETSTGKSQFMRAVGEALGTYGGTAQPSAFRGNLDERPRSDIMDIISTRVAVLDEGSQFMELHADQVKRLTGETMIAARLPYARRTLKKVPDFTPVLVSNEVPRIKGADEALHRRLTTIEFKNKPTIELVSKRAEFLGDHECMTALLARLVEGAVLAHNEGIGEMPLEMAKFKMKISGQFDDVGGFFDWAIEHGRIVSTDLDQPIRSFIGVSELYRMYVMYVSDYGDAHQKRDRLSLIAFGKRLKSLGYETRRSDGMYVLGWRAAASQFNPL